MPKMVHFCEFAKSWSLRSNSVTRQVTFTRTKIGVKRQNWRYSAFFMNSKCKRSSLRSQCWMRLFLWFSNTVSWTQNHLKWKYVCVWYITIPLLTRVIFLIVSIFWVFPFRQSYAELATHAALCQTLKSRNLLCVVILYHCFFQLFWFKR